MTASQTQKMVVGTYDTLQSFAHLVRRMKTDRRLNQSRSKAELLAVPGSKYKTSNSSRWAHETVQRFESGLKLLFTSAQ